MVQGNPRTKLVSVTHDISITGNQVITGAGFKPNSAVVLSVIAGQKIFSIGLSDGNTNGIIGEESTTSNIYPNTSNICAIIFTVGGVLEADAAFVSFDNDGMTINWTKVGLPVGTATLIILFMG
jgi:hypothetical protein